MICGLARRRRGGQAAVRARRRRWSSGRGVSTSPSDCLRCGVCCHSKLDTYVRVTGDDWARLGDAADRVAHFLGNRAYMRMNEAGRCAALEVRATADGAREFFCTVYARRPQVCRDLARGSPECEGERLAKGARVEAAGTV